MVSVTQRGLQVKLWSGTFICVCIGGTTERYSPSEAPTPHSGSGPDVICHLVASARLGLYQLYHTWQPDGDARQ